MVPFLVDVPQARYAPEDTRRRLRELDPTAECVYLGRGRWMVGKVRPNALVRQRAVNMLAKMDLELSQGKKLSEKGKEKARFALLALQGFRPVAEYHMPEPDGSVIRDFEQSRWLWLHESENETWRQLERTEGDEEDRRRRILGDEGLAREAWSRMFTTQMAHNGAFRPSETPVPSGRTRHTLKSA